MCGCNKNKLVRSISNNIVPDSVSYGELADRNFATTNDGHIFRAQQIAQGDIESQLNHIACLDYDALVRAFADNNVTISSPSDLKALAELSNSGKDIIGIQTEAGLVKFNTRNIVNNIEISTDKLKSATCDVKYMM